MFYGVELGSRLLLGTARYPSPAVLERAIKASGAEVVTVSLRREGGSGRSGQSFWSFIQSLGLRVLPNTAGCHSVKEAVTTAHMARELFDTKWIKLEVIGDDDTLQPDHRHLDGERSRRRVDEFRAGVTSNSITVGTISTQTGVVGVELLAR